MFMTHDDMMARIEKMAGHFLDLEENATDDGVRRYYSGIAEGLKKAYRIGLDELPDEYIRDH